MEFVGGLCNEVCNHNLDVKDEITKVIRLGKKHTNRDKGDTEQNPRPLKVEIKDTNKRWNCSNDYHTLEMTNINVSASTTT